MILIADSGSTKCSWALCNEKGEIHDIYNTVGFNPKYITVESAIKELEKSSLNKINEKINKVYFYGAGCSSKKRKKPIKDLLSSFFKNSKNYIMHDLEASVKASYNGSPIICCILGTGSNSCFYNGQKILENAPSLGYVLGDEGSGNYFGKKLINLYVNNKLPINLKQKFEKWSRDDMQTIIDNIYDSDRPNLYLANFFQFAYNNKSEKLINQMLKHGIRAFFDLHISCYNNYQNYPLAFTGSVAYFMKEYLKQIAKEYNCTIQSIIRSPINNLVKEHF